MSSTATTPPDIKGFRHEALFYGDVDGFAAAVAPFVRAGVEVGERVLVVVEPHKIEALRDALGPDTDGVHFSDMTELGRNPARIIPAWREFVDRHADGKPLRGVGEPIYPRRSAAELSECQRHEALLNIAFADDPAMWLVCPYDTAALPEPVLAEARRSHPFVADRRDHVANADYVNRGAAAAGFAEPLPEPPDGAATLPFRNGSLTLVRGFVAERAARAELAPARTSDLVLAVNELATNSLRHGGGHGTLRVWEDGQGLVCEVEDSGRLEEPLIGRMQPAPGRLGGRGLWMVNQLCDLVQIRSRPGHTVVRLHAHRD